MSKYENCVQAAMAQWRNFLNISIMKNETEVFVIKSEIYKDYKYNESVRRTSL